nr:hypothetical protein [Tanacetum cinerariifolium]
MAEGEIDNLTMTDFLQEPSIPGISLKRPLSQGTVYHQRLPSSLKYPQLQAGKRRDFIPSMGTGSSNSEGIAAIVIRLDNLGQDMKKLKENVHAIQVGCQNYRGAHLDKDYPLKEEVKSVKEAKYGEFGRPSPLSNRAKYRVGSLAYYIRIDNRSPFGENRPSLEDLMNKHLEEST